MIFSYKHFLICNPKRCINQAIKVTKNDIGLFLFFLFFLFLNVFTLIFSSQFVRNEVRSEEIYITKSDFFYQFFFICNPKPCINQAIKVNKSH